MEESDKNRARLEEIEREIANAQREKDGTRESI